jgi:hypothetical protein
MRMAPDHFLRDRVNDPAEIKESFSSAIRA